jgi:hypothetical protein
VVELRGEHPLNDLQRGLVGVAATLDKPRLDACLVHRPADRLAAAVDNHHPHPERRHEDDVEQQVPQGVGMLEDTATEFDDGGGVTKPADPTERLDEGVGLLNRLLLGPGGGWLAGHGSQIPRRDEPQAESGRPGKPRSVAAAAGKWHGRLDDRGWALRCQRAGRPRLFFV